MVVRETDHPGKKVGQSSARRRGRNADGGGRTSEPFIRGSRAVGLLWRNKGGGSVFPSTAGVDPLGAILPEHPEVPALLP